MRKRVLAKTVERANAVLEQPLPEGLSPHSLRRTYISILLASGADVRYVMGQVGHTDPSMTLGVYAQVIKSGRDHGLAVDALVGGADWAPMGTSGDSGADHSEPVEGAENAETPPERGFHDEAADGIRTHDLLHGKRSRIQDSPALSSALERLSGSGGVSGGRRTDPVGSRRIRLDPSNGCPTSGAARNSPSPPLHSIASTQRRVTKGIDLENAGRDGKHVGAGFVGGIFRHRTSRALDPQLRTHARCGRQSRRAPRRPPRRTGRHRDFSAGQDRRLPLPGRAPCPPHLLPRRGVGLSPRGDGRDQRRPRGGAGAFLKAARADRRGGLRAWPH